MVTDKINVRFVDAGQENVTISWPIQDLEYIEDLVYAILADKNVGPIYRLLFGLRFANIEPSVWLAPNVKIQELLNSEKQSHKNPTLELRMRFRPSSYTKMIVLDKTAFNFIFAQIRYDFIHTKFTDEKRRFILLNDSVLGLIATDLLRYALEKNININEIFDRVDPQEFIPHRASKWQRSLLFHLRQKLNLQKTVQIMGYKTSVKEVTNNFDSTAKSDKTAFEEAEEKAKALEVQLLQVKQGFIELFLYDVCKDYGAETYDVISMENPNMQQSLKIRVRYNQTKQKSTCIIESQPSSTANPSKPSDQWLELCDIDSICYGTLRQNAVEINRCNGRPFRVEFTTSLSARSFLSLIDGYYRLMRKWNFNFCRDVSSPYLEQLKKMRCHGPIGYETMRMKLPRQKEPGSFLVRKCMNDNNRFMIDVLVPRARLTIDIDWDPARKVFSKVDFSASDDIGVTILLNQQEYSNLKTLADDLQIKLAGDDASIPPLQLKNWVPPSEYDDCPALLLCISKEKLKEFDSDHENMVKSLIELPKLIPPGMLQFKSKLPQRSNNKMFVRLAVLSGNQEVVVKDHINYGSLHQSKLDQKDLVLNLSHKGFETTKFFQALHPVQVRLCDWLFMKNPMFADTIAVDLERFALIQEHFPLGPLDRFLSKRSRNVSNSMRRSVFCQLALALLFLQEKRIIHGKIRCHNIFIKNLDPIQVKISDMLGTLDADMDRAFLAPEYFRINGKLSIQEYDSGIDVWATGTTLWQIYSGGCKPPPWRYATTLIQPRSCPDEVWSIIESCWIIDPTNRASPQSLYRDANDLFAWEREVHNYDYISQVDEESTPSKQLSISSENHSMSTDQLSCESHVSNSRSNGSNDSGSQMNLLSTRTGSMVNNNLDFARLTEAICSNQQLVLGHPNGRRKSCRSWKNFMILKNRSENVDAGHNSDYEDRAGSKLSLSTGSTSSDSERTKSTMLMDSLNFAPDYGCTIDITKVKWGPEIGRGSCGVVIKGVLLECGGFSEQVVAVKCVNTTDLNNSNFVDDLRREAEILRNLKHDNIVRLLGVIDEGSPSLVLEYMPLGSLLSCIKNSHHEHLLSMPLKKYAIDIANGMKYLESERIVHRDLALRNVLLKNQNEVKICDFGLAQYLGSDNHYKLKTDRALPLRWYAPEALKYWTFNHKTDVWSYGIVLWEIYSGGSNPQYSGTYADLTETLKHERLLKPTDCPDPMYNLMLSCWAYEPEHRDSFALIHERLVALREFPVHSFGEQNFD